MAQALEDLARRCLDWARAQSAERDFDVEVYLAHEEERGVELRDGRLDVIQESVATGLGLRVVAGGRMGFASSGEASFEGFCELYRQVATQLPHLEPDPRRRLPGARAAIAAPELERSLWDETLFSESWDAVIPRLQALEGQIKGFDRRVQSMLRAGYGESRGEVVIASTRGVMSRERGTSANVGVSALCEEAGERQIGSAFQSARRRGDLDWFRVAREAAERAVALLGARKLPGARRAVVFDPWVAGEFLELISGLLCADEVQRGKSLLAGRLGQKIGSELATFVDDPRRVAGLASALHDDEGLPTSRKVMIEAGVVKDYFYDAYTAGREGRQSNASAGRASYKGLPGPGSTNFYLAAGRRSRQELIGSTEDGILLLDVMGMHMADPISGEFSVGVSGLRIEKGRVGDPIKSAMISGNLLDLLSGMDAVADDLTFYGGMGAPTFRVAGLNVA